MKRFLSLVAAALMVSACASSAFAVGWGPNGQFGHADPNAQPVGPSSTPSTNPASAPIINPPDPTKPSSFVPGSYNDPAVIASHTPAWRAMQIAKARAAVEGKTFDPKKGAKFAPQNVSKFQTPTNSLSRQNFGFGNGVPQLPQMPKPSRINSNPPRPHMH